MHQRPRLKWRATTSKSWVWVLSWQDFFTCFCPLRHAWWVRNCPVSASAETATPIPHNLRLSTGWALTYTHSWFSSLAIGLHGSLYFQFCLWGLEQRSKFPKCHKFLRITHYVFFPSNLVAGHETPPLYLTTSLGNRIFRILAMVELFVRGFFSFCLCCEVYGAHFVSVIKLHSPFTI